MDQLSTVKRAMQVLQAFSYEHPVLGVSELARQLGMGKSSVHRVLTTLCEEGFVVKTSDDRYRLGLKLHELGQQVVAGLELREVAHVPLERLRNESGETVHLAVLEGADVVYVHRIESQATLRMFSRVGRRVSAHTTSSGKCLLAFGDAADAEVVIAAGLPRVGPRSITTKTAFLEALRKIRSDGYAVSVEETERGVVSVGAPVFGHDRSCVAAVSMAGPMLRMTEERIPKLARMVRRCALEISTGMGFLDRSGTKPIADEALSAPVRSRTAARAR